MTYAEMSDPDLCRKIAELLGWTNISYGFRFVCGTKDGQRVNSDAWPTSLAACLRDFDGILLQRGLGWLIATKENMGYEVHIYPLTPKQKNQFECTVESETVDRIAHAFCEAWLQAMEGGE